MRARRVLAVIVATVAGMVLLWSLWMLSFLVGFGYKDSANLFYATSGGAGLLLAAALGVAAALLFLR